uniref:Tumor necrosis factor receptor superfamily member 6 n=1 Tax=Amphilophus citrinellus TaxID=61819 RepID=A0A3Q0R2B9_AMPCI
IEGRRQVCADGSYELEGRTCCLCSAGQRVKEHCTPDSQNDGQCEHCENGTYNSVANFQETCQPCTSCSHPNAHLEEEEPCTIVRNTKCRCKKHHFCSSKECTICHPCKICAINSTSTLLIVLMLLCAVKKHDFIQGTIRALMILYNVNLEPLLPDTAKELGWKDMRSVAGHTGVTVTVTESCKMEHPNDPKEQTLQLLRRWVGKEDRDAANKLIRTLKNKDKKGKAQKISDIVSKGDSAPAGNS